MDSDRNLLCVNIHIYSKYMLITFFVILSCSFQMAGFFWYFRVATAQGKQGIRLLTFPDRENTGNLVNLIFYTGKIVPTQGKF